MADRKADPSQIADPRRSEVFRAADQIRAEGMEGMEGVALRNVWARVKQNAGVAGNNQRVGAYLSEWAEERGYSPVIELAGMPEKVSTQLAKAGVEIWKAAQAEAAMVLERDRCRMEEAVAFERELRDGALGMVDARDAIIESQRQEIARLVEELARVRQSVRAVRAREFWRRVAQEIWEILPEWEALHLNDIAQRIGREVVKEAEDYPGQWGPELLRGVVDRRIKYRNLFASEGRGRYRRRRPEDDAP